MLWVVVEQKKAIAGWSFLEVVLIEKLKVQASKNLPAGLTRTVFGNRCLRFDKEVVNRFPLLDDLTYPQTQRYTVAVIVEIVDPDRCCTQVGTST
ncbi:TPA: hypothetical protein QHU55_004671 [Klebsiella aerogenes]|nr:hypothetical protein [Klebsiella aerogenes]HDS6532724.1 hypothetical protein [Klebsiella aerogenes]HDS7502313.1 hypothetical protein [Klebsiella aerogenes]HDS9642404.1 hypothetical protein [Klebsiella aerogenes]HDT2317329.1 hypothetical protein [Klebsiella aerogenes]